MSNGELDNKQDDNELSGTEESLVNIPGPNMSPPQAAVFALITVFLLYQIGGSILTLLIFGFDLKNADVNAMRLLTAGGQILLILAPTLIFAKLVYRDVTAIIRFKLPKLKEVGIFVLGLAILIPLLQAYLALQNQLLAWLAEQVGFFSTIKEFLDSINEFIEATYLELLRADGMIEAALIIFIVSVVPSVCEETFFRGFVMRSFEFKYTPFVSALITAVFFGFYHFNPYGLIALIILGVYMGYSTYMSGSIFIAMLLHFINNFVAIMAFFIFGEKDFMETAVFSSEALSGQFISFFALLGVFVTFIYYVKKYYNTLKNKEVQRA